MSLTASLADGKTIRATEVTERTLFLCRTCREPLIFVDAVMCVKHFRHYPTSNCISAPETEKHRYYKLLVFDVLSKLVKESKWVGDKVYLEEEVQGLRADVLWSIDNPGGPRFRIAFEIQVSDIGIDAWQSKIIRYQSNRDVFVVYLFVPGKFYRRIKDYKTLFKLRQIELDLVYLCDEICSELFASAYFMEEKEGDRHLRRVYWDNYDGNHCWQIGEEIIHSLQIWFLIYRKKAIEGIREISNEQDCNEPSQQTRDSLPSSRLPAAPCDAEFLF